MRATEGKSPCLAENNGVDAAVEALTIFMALRCFAFKNQSQTIRGYLAAKYFHKTVCGVGVAYVPLHGACGRKRNRYRAHGKPDVRPRVKVTLTWNMFTEEMDRFIEV